MTTETKRPITWNEFTPSGGRALVDNNGRFMTYEEANALEACAEYMAELDESELLKGSAYAVHAKVVLAALKAARGD